MEHVKEVSNVKKKAPSFEFGKFLRKYNLFFLLIVFIAIGSALSPKFLTVQNFLNLLQQSAVVGIISIGMTFVIIVAGIDLSVGSVLALAGMVWHFLFRMWGFLEPSCLELSLVLPWD